MALLDANEQWHPRVGSDADGGGAGGSDAGSSGASGRGAVGSGAVRNGVAGRNAFGNGNYGSADRSNTQGGTDFDERLITPRLAATALTGAQLISIGLTAGAAGLTVAGLTVTWLAAAGLTAAGLLAAWRSRRHLESSKRATRERQGSGGIASELVAAELTAAWSAASGMAATESTGLTAAAGLVAAGTLATWLAVAGMETIGLTAAWLAAAGLTAVWYGRQYLEGSHGLRAAANAVILDDSTAQRRQPLAAQRKGRLAARKQRRQAKQHKQLTREQGRRCISLGHAFCARAVVVDDDGRERFLGFDESEDDGIPDRPSHRLAGQCIYFPGARQGGEPSSEGQEPDAKQRGARQLDVMQPPVQPIRARTATGYKGVNHDQVRGVFRAVAIDKGQKRRLGDFPTALEAAICYAQHVRGQRGQPTQATQAVGDDGLQWQVHMAPGTASGYAGVDAPPSARKLGKPYRARYGGHSLGYYATATEAAVAHAQCVCILDAIGTGAIGEAALQAAQRLELEGRIEGSFGAGMSGTDADIAAVAGVPLAWVAAELMGADPDESYGGRGGSEQSCSGHACGDLGCGELSYGKLGCSSQGCGDLGCSELNCGDLGYSGQGCGDMGCGGLSCGKLGCSGKDCGDLSCDDLSCGGLSCSIWAAEIWAATG